MRTIAVKGIQENKETFYTASIPCKELKELLTNVSFGVGSYPLLRLYNNPTKNYLIIAVIEGSPLWTEVRFEVENEKYSNVGILEFTGEEKLVYLDYSNNLLSDNSDFDVPVLIVKYKNLQ